MFSSGSSDYSCQTDACGHSNTVSTLDELFFSRKCEHAQSAGEWRIFVFNLAILAKLLCDQRVSPKNIDAQGTFSGFCYQLNLRVWPFVTFIYMVVFKARIDEQNSH